MSAIDSNHRMFKIAQRALSGASLAVPSLLARSVVIPRALQRPHCNLAEPKTVWAEIETVHANPVRRGLSQTPTGTGHARSNIMLPSPLAGEGPGVRGSLAA